ncbi:hypothetical protein [Actinoplanes sp. NPDC026623]|uniref:hypothetical protein n=1 Tax=Actinoplanes sp. NPDC026623 TaxID=3155610 RepID=UPI0033C0C207
MSEPNISVGAVPDNPTYAGFFEVELKSEVERKSKIDGRGASLVTSSGAIHAVLVGLGSINQGSARSAIPHWTMPFLMLAILTFLAAAVAGVVAQLNRGYEATGTAGLKSLLNERWRDSSGESMHHVSTDRYRAIESLQSSNDRKAIALRWGYGFQLAAIAFLGPVAFAIVAIK